MKLINKLNGNLIAANQEFLDAHADEYEEYIVDEVVESITLPVTDIAVIQTRFKVGETVTFDFTSELPDDSYFIPYRVVGDTRKYLKDAVVADGIGSIVFNFTIGGIYYIDVSDLPLTELQVNSSSADKFTIYVAE